MFEVSKELAVEGILRAFLYQNGIIEINWDPSIQILQPSDLDAMQNAVKQLGNGVKMPLYFTTHPFLQVSEEAQAYATSEEGTRYSKAIAVMMEDLATKIDYNVFIKKNTPVVPTQAFTEKSEAFKWLLTFRD